LGLTANGRLNSFSATTNGLFSSDPAPLVGGVVPEAATWALMLLGFGGVGSVMRVGRRRSTVLTA